MPCRAKKAKCSGDKPACTNCEKFRLECTWPDGRKRKRTRKEMEADFGKRPALATAESDQPMASRGQLPSGAKPPNQPASERSESTSVSAQIAPEGSSAAAARFAFAPSRGAQGNEPGLQQDPLLSQTMNMFASGPSFSPQPPPNMFFPSNTGFPLQQPSTSDVNRMRSGSGAMDRGTGSAGMGTPHTIWQFLANLPSQGSLLPPYANQGEDALQMLSGMDGQPLGSTSIYPQQPLPVESLYQPIPGPHDPSPQIRQSGPSSREFSSFDPPPASTSAYNGKAAEPIRHSTETRTTPAENPGTQTGTPSMTGLMKAITNQIGYLEGDESKPYLRLHYFRVVSRFGFVGMSLLTAKSNILGWKHL